MSDKTETVAPDFGFVEVETVEKTNEYDAVVAAQIARGPKTGYPLTAPADEVEKHLRRYARAANRAEKSPKRGQETDNADGTKTVVVTLRDRIVKNAAEVFEVAEADAE